MAKRLQKRRQVDLVDRIFLVLAVLLIPMIGIEYLFPISMRIKYYFELYYILLYVLFLLEFLIRFFLSHSKKHYLAVHWFEPIFIVFPFLRILRVFRILEFPLIIFEKTQERKSSR